MTTPNTMDKIFVKFKLIGRQRSHTVSIANFFKLDPKLLNKGTQKVQEVLRQLYKLNDRNPPLYREFADMGKDMPLVIDCNPCKCQDSPAAFEEKANRIELRGDALSTYNKALLQCILAHELKHAEQYSKEHIRLQSKIVEKHDGLACYQMRMLEEAQAYAMCDYVSYLASLDPVFPKQKSWYYFESLLPILKKHTHGKDVDSFRDIEYSMVKLILPELYHNDWFALLKHEKDPQGKVWVISKEDKGLSTISRSFNFKHPQAFFALIQKLPREEFPQKEKKKKVANSVQSLKQQNDGR